MHPATTALVATVRAADRLAPAIAGRLALPLFRQVRPVLPVRPADRAVHEHAARGTITVRGREIVTYSWGSGARDRARGARLARSRVAVRPDRARAPRRGLPGHRLRRARERRLRGPAHRHPRLPGRDRRDAAAPWDVPRRHRALVRRPGRAHRRARGHRDRRRGGDRRHGRRPVPGRLVRRAGRRGRGDRRRARRRVRAPRGARHARAVRARRRRRPPAARRRAAARRARPRRSRGRGIRVAATARRPRRALAPRAHRRSRSRARARRRRDARRGDGVRHGRAPRARPGGTRREGVPAASA